VKAAQSTGTVHAANTGIHLEEALLGTTFRTFLYQASHVLAETLQQACH